jgi:hypothetical protein
MARGYSEPVGSDYGADDNSRDRWREDNRESSNWRDRDDNRGFFERAGDEVRSWFSDDDHRDRDLRSSRSSWDSDREFSRSGAPRSTSWDRNLDRSSFPESGRTRSFGREDRSSFGGMAQSGYSRPSGSFSRERDRFGSSERGFGGFRDESDFRSQQRSHPQSWGEANRGQSNWDRDRERNLGDSHLGYGDFSGTLGGFGNQTFGSSEHDHYRNWRDREMAKLDRDYDDYCREREQKFNQDFDSWRRSRPTQSQSNADLGVSSNAGVGTTTASMTGTAGSGSAIGSATGTGGSIQSDTTGSTETADAGSGRSSTRSRS